MTDKERILLVENDPEICDQIAKKSLIPLGYQIKVVQDVNIAITAIRDFTPDVILVDINLPGLSGKDMLIAITSQGVQVHVIMIARKGQENDILQAFRMGADDFITWPARETEVVAVIEGCLQKSRDVRDSKGQNFSLRESINEAEEKLQDITSLLTISKELISTRDQSELLDKVLQGVARLSCADMGWIYTYDRDGGSYKLAAVLNLPELWVKKLGTTMDDGISTMAFMSGERLALNGVSLKRFKVANLGQSAAVIPIKNQDKVVGLFVLVRNENTPFEKRKLDMLGTAAEMTSLWLEKMNAIPIHRGDVGFA
ncbi:response regulator [Chloroflexota bacterium]